MINNIADEVIHESEADSKLVKISLQDLEDRNYQLDELKALLGFLPKGTMVAGGAFERIFNKQKPNDYDIFVPSDEKMQEIVEVLKDNGFVRTKKGNSKFVELKLGELLVQVIGFIDAEDLSSVFDRFDFTVCMFGMYAGIETIYTRSGSLIDLNSKSVVINKNDLGINAPASTLRRLVKYSKKGYTACGGALQDLVDQIRKLTDEQIEETRKVTYID